MRKIVLSLLSVLSLVSNVNAKSPQSTVNSETNQEKEVNSSNNEADHKSFKELIKKGQIETDAPVVKDLDCQTGGGKK